MLSRTSDNRINVCPYILSFFSAPDELPAAEKSTIAEGTDCDLKLENVFALALAKAATYSGDENEKPKSRSSTPPPLLSPERILKRRKATERLTFSSYKRFLFGSGA